MMIFCSIVAVLFASAMTQAIDEEKVYDHIRMGKYTIINNVWGKYAFGYKDKTDNKQSIFRRKEADGPDIFGWNWEWPIYQGNVKGYPAVMYGWKPGYSKTTTASLPKKFKDIKAISASYDIICKGTGTYNLAFDLWVVKDQKPAQGGITREIMVWIDNTNWEMDKRVPFAGKVNIDGADYNFYDGKLGWSYLAFVKIKKEHKGKLALDKFIGYLIGNNYITADEYLASIELGNEIIEGKGETVIRSYSVKVVP